MDEEQWKSGAKTRDQLLLCSLLLPKVTRNGKKRREREKHFSPFSFFQLIPHASSSAPVILASTHAALSGYSEIEIHLSA